jgi:hypothetical protein
VRLAPDFGEVPAAIPPGAPNQVYEVRPPLDPVSPGGRGRVYSPAGKAGGVTKRTEEPQMLLLPENGAEPEPELKSWALVELFGHQRIVGFLTQQTFGSGVLFRVDVPDLTKEKVVIRKGFTRYFGLSAIYSITPVDEQTVRELLPMIDGTPAARPLTLRSYDRQERDY